jgi:hypothetical protein
MAGYSKRIICYANSRKTSGRCVAGREIVGDSVGAWIRPISVRASQELSEDERRYQDGTDPKLLDVIDVWMTEPKPHGYQTENHIIDDNIYWGFVRKATPAELEASIEASGPLWENISSSGNGLHDRIHEANAGNYGNSLKLINVQNLVISVGVEGAAFGNAKRKVRGHFTFDRVDYILAVTDPIVERQYLAGQDGQFAVGAATLCVSLGEVWNGYGYKLIAAVVPPP